VEHEQGARWRDWVNILGRVRFGTQMVAGKTVSGFTVKAVGERLAQYGNPDGTEVRPGIARIAVDLETGHTTVRNAIKVLERVGLIRLEHPASRTKAAVYRLVIGAELIEKVELWSPSRYALEIEKVSRKYRGSGPFADSSGVGNQAVSPTPQESVITVDDLPIADSSGSENPGLPTPLGVESPTPEESATNHGPRSNYDQPNRGDDRTKLAVSRASRPPCPHGNSSRARRDGQPRCDQCRTALETQSAIADVRLSPTKCPHGLKNSTNARGEVACFACRRGIPA